MNDSRLAMEKIVFGSNKAFPINYIEKALQNGKNIAVVGKNTCKKKFFARSMLGYLPEKKIYLADCSNVDPIRKLYPGQLSKECHSNGDDGIFYIDESDCSNMKRILPQILFSTQMSRMPVQILSVYEADNNR